MEKIDLKRKYLSGYTSNENPKEITIPSMQYLAIDGKGDPNDSPEFEAAIRSLYTVSYTLKFIYKNERQINYPVMALEGLWWTEDMKDFKTLDKTNWLWTLMIVLPEFISEEDVKLAKERAFEKKGYNEISELRILKLEESTSAQLMHIGPFSEEGDNIKKLHEFIKSSGHTFDGLKQKHHEIYLSDMRKTAPERLKTIIRQPYL